MPAERMTPQGERAVARASVLGLACMIAGAAWGQENPGDVWFDLPAEGPIAGQDYMVKVHVNVGDQNPDTLQINLTFPNDVLKVAFDEELGGFPPVIFNADLELGETLVVNMIDDLVFNHREQNPGVITLGRAEPGAPWDLSGDIELLRITFHPLTWASNVRLDGEVINLFDGQPAVIGDPQVVPVTLTILPPAPFDLPLATSTGLLALAAGCLWAGGIGIRRRPGGREIFNASRIQRPNTT